MTYRLIKQLACIKYQKSVCSYLNQRSVHSYLNGAGGGVHCIYKLVAKPNVTQL